MENYIGKKLRLKVSREPQYVAGEEGTITDEYPCDGKYRWEVQLTPIPRPDYVPGTKVDCGPLGVFDQLPEIHRFVFFYENEVEFI
jgi:hypothetical protein